LLFLIPAQHRLKPDSQLHSSRDLLP